MGITHATQITTGTDSGDGRISKNAWNADHVGASNDVIWTPGSNPYSLDDEFNNASLDAAWTKVNTSRVTWTEGADVLSVLNTGGDGNAEIHAILKSLGSFSYPLTVETAFRYYTPYAYNYIMLGPIFTDGTTNGSGSQVWAMPYSESTMALSSIISVRSFSNFNTQTAQYNYGGWQWTGGPLFVRLTLTSANTWSLSCSPDGVSWITHASGLSMSLTPTHVGLATSTWTGNSPVIGSYEYFRVF